MKKVGEGGGGVTDKTTDKGTKFSKRVVSVRLLLPPPFPFISPFLE